jgi:4-hydroxy-4-methyl-2-oxoglutarate aldolase
MAGKTLLGKLDRSAFGTLELPRLPAEVLQGFLRLEDLTGMTSDALDQCGIAGAVPGSILRPTDPAARMVGQALTVLNRRLEKPSKVSKLGEIEAHNLAEPGDVLVIQGVAGISSMGGISASVGKRQGEAGAVVEGAVRDIDHSRRIGYPVWSSGVSPITGKWRIETVAVNRPVRIAGIEVHPGDLVVADECGVCFVPFGRAGEVLAVAHRLAESEKERLASLARGIALAEFAAIPRKG